MMVGQWASEHRPGTYVNVSAMDSSEQLPSDRQQPPSVEISPRHTNDDVQPTTSTTSSDIAYQPLLTSESQQSWTICQELDRNWIEKPSFAIVCTPMTVQCSVVIHQTPSLQSPTSTMHNGGTGPRRRILPLTKYSQNLMSSDVTETPAAPPICATPSRTLPRDVREWFPDTGKQPAPVLMSPDALVSDFAKLFEAFDSDFPPDGSTSAVASDAAVTEPELVTPMSSLHIGPDVPAPMRDPVEDGARSSRSSSMKTRTHPGSSTLLYRLRNNPGLHRPRTYRCNIEGQSIYTTSYTCFSLLRYMFYWL